MSANESTTAYYVREAQENLRRLEKENFKLKLTLYYLERGHEEKPTKLPLQTAKPNDEFREYEDIETENVELKSEIQDKIETMRYVTLYLNALEKMASEYQLFHESELKKYMNRICILKKKRTLYRGKGRDKVSPRVHKKISTLKSQNDFLHREMRQLNSQVRLQDSEVVITDLGGDTSVSLEQLNSENERILKLLYAEELEYSNLKLRSQQLQRLVNEQKEMIKSLNKTIDAVKGKANDYKSKLEFEPNKLDEAVELSEGHSMKNRYPLHNPLFGSIENS